MNVFVVQYLINVPWQYDFWEVSQLPSATLMNFKFLNIPSICHYIDLRAMSKLFINEISIKMFFLYLSKQTIVEICEVVERKYVKRC